MEAFLYCPHKMGLFTHYRERCAFLFARIHSVNSIYHLSNLSTQHPQYQNQPLNSPSFSTVDQFPLTHKMKQSGIQNLSSDKSRLPEIPCSLHFFAIWFFDFWHQYYALHMCRHYDRNTLLLPRRLYGNTNRRVALLLCYSFLAVWNCYRPRYS